MMMSAHLGVALLFQPRDELTLATAPDAESPSTMNSSALECVQFVAASSNFSGLPA